MKSRIDIIGAYPPPYGGISVHIMRLLPYCDENGVKYRLYNIGEYGDLESNIFSTGKSYLWWLKYFLFPSSTETVHFHFFTLFHYVYAFLFSWFHQRKIIITLHGEELLSPSSYQKTRMGFLFVRFLEILIKPFLEICLRATRNCIIISVSNRINKTVSKSKWTPKYPFRSPECGNFYGGVKT